MSQVARYGQLVAYPGRGQEIADLLVKAAERLAADPGCELYLINRESAAPDTIWVTELWRSQADLDASIERIRGSEEVATVMGLVERAKMIELDPLGGKGPRSF